MNSEIEENIRKKVTWDQLPTHVKKLLGNSPKEYDKSIVSFSIKNQLRYRGNLVRAVLKNEKRYYERVVASSRERLMLFPYHLADMIVKGLRVTPFIYYISVVERLMQADKSYDTLPNFTAADCLRLLGIGRNEYIELMNKSRSGKRSLFGRRNVRSLLPLVPLEIHMEPWWRVEVGLVLEDDIKMITPEEKELIDKLIDFGSQTAGDFDYNIVKSLYRKGLIYLDVPITGVDKVQVPPLQGFVMNRILGDYFETLLYKIFVSIDEHMTVSELAAVLQVDVESVKQAVSLYCRLGFAKKLNADSEWDLAKRHPSWNNRTSPNLQKKTHITPLTFDLNLPISRPPLERDASINESPATNSLSKSGQRIAFLFDSTLTAFLMMGNLSPGLKSHAVTMFEVGKLSDECLDGLISELDKVSLLDAEGEGEARRYFDHAVILRATVLALRNLVPAGLDLVRCESLHSLDAATCSRLLKKKYKLLVSMTPLSREVHPVSSIAPPHLGPAIPEVNSLWFKLFVYHITGYGPPSLLLTKGTVLKQLPRMFLGFSYLLVTAWRHEPAIIPSTSILHVNSTLRYSAVLIQAYGVHNPALTSLVPFPLDLDTSQSRRIVRNINKTEWSSHPAIKNLSEIVDLEHSCGYLTMACIGVRDLGCEKRDINIKLGKPLRKMTSPTSPGKHELNILDIKRDATCISNENFHFPEKKINSSNKLSESNETTTKSDENKLQSPVDTHFANSPELTSGSASPANGFTCQESTALLNQELDQLEIDEQKKLECSKKKPDLLDMDMNSFESLLSPLDENISMFSRIGDSDLGLSTSSVDNLDVANEKYGEEWTILECNFGVPLFDVDANTKICHAITSKGLTEAKSLEKLIESNQKLSDMLLNFILQCQYFPEENKILTKKVQFSPQPRINLIFDNGRISVWNGK